MNVKKPDYTRIVNVVEKASHASVQTYRAEIVGDDKGSLKLAKLYADGPHWTINGQNLVSIEDRDCHMRITFPRKNLSFDLPLCDVGDLRALLEVLQRTERVKYFTPLKISEVIEIRRKKVK